MLSDSPYNLEGMILKPSVGFLAGIGAALAMLPVLLLLKPAKLPLQQLLERFGTIILSGTEAPIKLAIVGTIIHLLLGGLFGLLYALCQVSIPKKGLIGVGISYGVVLWALSSLFTHWIYRDALGEFIHTWVWLLASILFGSILAQVAIWTENHRPKAKQALPVD